MNAPVQDEPLHGFAGNLAAHRIVAGQHDRVGGVVNEHGDAGGRFEGANIASLPPDNSALDVVTLEGHGGGGGLECVFTGVALDRKTDNAARLFLRLEPGFLDDMA